MNTQKEKIKLNIPCSICNKELFLGTGLVSFGDERTPVHLECYNKAGKSETIKQVLEIIDDWDRDSLNFDYRTSIDELISKIGELTTK